MRRFPYLATVLHVVKGLLLGKDGLFVCTLMPGVVLAPILLNSCRNVQPEEADRAGGSSVEAQADGARTERDLFTRGVDESDASPGTPTAGATKPPLEQRPADDNDDVVAAERTAEKESVQGAAAEEELVDVAAASAAEAAAERAAGPAIPISYATQRTARGLPDELAGYASWYVLEDPDGIVAPPATEEACRAYIELPLEVDAMVGDPLPLPFEERTVIAIESKRRGEDFIRRIDTLKRGRLGWDLRCFVRESAADGFEEEPSEARPDDAACWTLLAAIEAGGASLVLGE